MHMLRVCAPKNKCDIEIDLIPQEEKPAQLGCGGVRGTARRGSRPVELPPISKVCDQWMQPGEQRARSDGQHR